MENWSKYYLRIVSLLLFVSLFCSCDRLSNETYRNLDANERRKLSSEYLGLAKSLGTGTPNAMKLLDKAARINPENELVWMELSWPYLYTGHYKEWNEHMEKAIALNPREWQGNRGLTKLTFFKDYGGALYDFEAHDTIKTDISSSGRIISTYYLKGLCYLGLKNYEEAENSLTTYLIKEAEKTGTSEIDPTAYIYLGIIANYRQDYKLALEHLQKAMDENDPLADSYHHAAYANFMMGKAKLANEQIIKAKELYKEESYHKNRWYEVQFQLYERDIENLEKEISCFL